MLKRKWKLIAGVLVVALIAFLAFINRHWLIEAFELARNINMSWLILAQAIILSSFMVLSMVFRIILKSQGYHIGQMRLWATAMVSVVLSQSVPPGGVWSYAFLVGAFKHRGLSTARSALIATLDMLSYAIAMLSIVTFSLIYLAFHNLTTEGGSYLAATIALIVVIAMVFVLTRSEAQLKYWLLGMKNWLERVFRQSWSDEPLLHFISEISHGRRVIAEDPRDVFLTVPFQFIGLCGHSLAMLVILHGLGVDPNFLVVLSSFGIALLTSSFNILPGGGGTVETALVAVLLQFQVGPAALPAAIIFRLLNFWFMIPIATICYYWLMRDPPPNEGKRGPHEKTKLSEISPRIE
jgi:uncharacterized protein (TIRG00374 family)